MRKAGKHEVISYTWTICRFPIATMQNVFFESFSSTYSPEAEAEGLNTLNITYSSERLRVGDKLYQKIYA